MIGKQKILIVDDDENIAELISLYLTKECFDTKMVYNGEDALAAFVTYRLFSVCNMSIMNCMARLFWHCTICKREAKESLLHTTSHCISDRHTAPGNRRLRLHRCR